MFSKNIQKNNDSVEDTSETSSYQMMGELVSMLNTLYSVQLPPVPTDFGKEFCVGLLENPDAHPWRSMWETLPCNKRYGIAHSLFLFRKAMPSTDTPESAAAAAISRLCKKSDSVDPQFLKFMELEIPKIFRPGWDKSYQKKVCSLTLSTKSCLEGGVSRDHNFDQHAMRAKLLNDEIINCSRTAKVAVVSEGGKNRVVTVNSVRHHALQPLHNLIYSHLSKKEWLLRGDAKPSKFDGFESEKGLIYCSGDYESATDNIPFAVYRKMLNIVQRCSTNTGSSVWKLAHQQVARDLVYKGRTYQATRGQLMGSYLSFPFLCLLNYLIFKYSVGDRPVKINGDDIVFKGTLDEIERWKKTVATCGLVLSEGKTLVHRDVFTLNSTIFRAYPHAVGIIPFIRSKAYFKGTSDPDSLKGRYESFVIGGPALARMQLKAQFLKRNWAGIWGCQRSLSKALGLKVNKPILKLAGLWKRERFYYSVENEKPVPIVKQEWDSQPPGWRRIETRLFSPEDLVERLAEEKAYYGPEMVDFTWTDTRNQVTTGGILWARMRFGTLRYFDRVMSSKFRIRESKVYKAFAGALRPLPLEVRKGKKNVCVRVD